MLWRASEFPIERQEALGVSLTFNSASLQANCAIPFTRFESCLAHIARQKLTGFF
jgi:hypothetical protein